MGRQAVPPFIILRWYAATQLFWLCLLFPVMRCFVGSKRPAQVAHQIAQVFWKVLVAYLVEVITPLFIGRDHKTQHFFTGQRDSVLRFLRSASIFSVNVLEIPLSGREKATTECLVVEDEGDR